MVECPYDKKKSRYSTIQDVGKNFPLQEIIENQKLKEKETYMLKRCKLHRGEKMNFFCKKDNVYLCQHCLITSHLGHDLEPALPLLLG